MSDKLLPCPFCGSAPDLNFDEHRHHNEDRREEHRWDVTCSASAEVCPIMPMTHCTSKAEAIRQWNTRSPAPTGLKP